MTVFTVKDWRNATTHEGGGDTTTPISAAALEDLETRVTSSGGRTITAGAAAQVPLTLKGAGSQTGKHLEVVNSADTSLVWIGNLGQTRISNDDSSQRTLTLANRTSGANPANVPSLGYEKDNVLRWVIGVDVQAGDQGDLAFWHSNAYSGGNSGDFIYMTDEDNPGVAIGHGTVDRTLATGAQFTVSNPSGASRPAATFIQNVAGAQPTVKIYRDSALQTAPFLECRDLDINDLHASITTDGAFWTAAENPALVFSAGIGLISWVGGSNLYEGSANTLMIDKNLYVDDQLIVGPQAALFARGAGHASGAVLGFWNAAGYTSKPTVSGATGGNAALQDLLAKLATYGLITNSTT